MKVKCSEGENERRQREEGSERDRDGGRGKNERDSDRDKIIGRENEKLKGRWTGKNCNYPVLYLNCSWI